MTIGGHDIGFWANDNIEIKHWPVNWRYFQKENIVFLFFGVNWIFFFSFMHFLLTFCSSNIQIGHEGNCIYTNCIAKGCNKHRWTIIHSFQSYKFFLAKMHWTHSPISFPLQKQWIAYLPITVQMHRFTKIH